MTHLSISDWRPLLISLSDIGPFRGELTSISFLSDPDNEADQGAPSNLYMFLAKNGYGKTTILESIHGLFGLMSRPNIGRFVDSGPEKVQLDIRSLWTIDGHRQTVLLSIWIGSDQPLIEYDPGRLLRAQCEQWAGISLSKIGPIPLNELARLFRDELGKQLQTPPNQLFGRSQNMPTVIYFPADRLLYSPKGTQTVEVPATWGYQPAQTFDSDGPNWSSTTDNLLVWLRWIDENQLEEMIGFLNETLFSPAGKTLNSPIPERLRSMISVQAGGSHEISQLSHGERALLQIYSRVLAYMTQNTIVLLDEIELHLHPALSVRLYLRLKELLVSLPSLSLIFSTHDRGLLSTFNHTHPEKGIVKGGYFIKDGLE